MFPASSHAEQPALPVIPFFGRASEMAQIRAVVEDARAASGRGRAVLLTGPAGVGKSRLMNEVRRGLRAEGHAVLEAWWRPTDFRPHGPLVDLLGISSAFLLDMGHPGPETRRALALLTGLPGGEPVALAQDRELHFFEAVRRALLEVAAVRPPVLFLHDLHRADRSTLGLLRHLLENLLTDPAFDWAPEGSAEGDGRGSRLLGNSRSVDSDLPAFRGLLMVSFRETEATRSLVEVARASDAVEHLALGGLDTEGVRAFLQLPAVVERVHRATGGQPAALEDLLASLPARPEAIWPARFAGLDAEARAVLDVMAVYQRPCPPARVQDLSERDEDLRPLLVRLEGLRILSRGLDRGALCFRFAQAGGREAWLAQMSAERRAALHRALAERLAAAADLGVEPEEIAQHYLLGDAAAEAVPFALQAADRLESACAVVRAVELIERVLPATEGALRADLLDRLARLYSATGALDRARAALLELAAVRPAQGASFVVRLATLHLRAGEPGEARRVAEAALDAEADQGLAADDAARPELVAVAAEAAYQAGDLAGAAELAGRLESESAGPGWLASRNTLGKISLARDQLDEAQRCFDANLTDAQRLGDGPHEARALINLGVVQLQRGEQERARSHFESARRLSADIGELRLLALSLENLAVLHHRRQEFARAMTWYHQSTAAFRQLGDRGQLATSALNLADLYLVLGDDARARRLADIAGALVRRGHRRHLEPQRLMVEGDLARHEGDLARAADHYATAVALIEAGEGSNQRLGPLLLAQAELSLEREEHATARALLERAATVEPGQDDRFRSRLRAARGVLLAAEGDSAGAEAELEAAIALADEAEDREAAWQARARLAEVQWGKGRRAETLQALAGAVEIIERAAGALPSALREQYHRAPRRAAVRASLRRVRVGVARPGTLAPLRADEAREARGRAAPTWRPEWSARYPQIIGRDVSLYPVLNALDRVAGSDSMVLIRGESGTGKELVAGALHAHSPRSGGPFVKVNCAAFVETLLLSELFGHERGAFTGAVSAKKGRFELASGGTLFLDEIGDISPNTQVALLRVLQEGSFERVGGSETVTVDVRVICATHRNLEQMVREGGFRADLYYRLRGVIIEIPPLRDRRRDIPALVDHFLCRRPDASRRPLRFTREALASLLEHDWPGNIRELENVVRSVALFADGDAIGIAELGELGDLFHPPSEKTLLLIAESQAAAGAGVGLPEGSDSATGSGPGLDPPAGRGAADDEGQFGRADGVSTGDESELGAALIPDDLDKPLGEGTGELTEAWLEAMIERAGGLSELKKQIELRAIAVALRASGGNITQAASRLGMKRPRLSQIIHATPALGALKDEVNDP